jgi:type IV secretory pathway TrbD component
VGSLLSRLPERIKRALEGKHPWGYFEVAPLGRTVWMRQRLTVFPPGTNAAERRALTFHRDWPLTGAIVAMFAMMGFGAVLPPFGACLLAFALYGVGMWLSARATRRLRAASRRLIVVVVGFDGGAAAYGNIESMKAARTALERLDRDDHNGLLTPTQYEAEWASVYRAIDDHRAALIEELEEGILSSERRPGSMRRTSKS